MPHHRNTQARPSIPSLRVLVAPDKFKGTLTARAAAAALARGWRRARPGDDVQMLPISDGGDGFGAAIGELLRARKVAVTAVDAAHRSIRTQWWWELRTGTAVVESARVVGLAMLPPGQFHPFELDTLGLGIVLRQAVERGARRCLIGLGGSATNDGGFGLARGLGWTFVDGRQREITRWVDLARLSEIRPPAKKLRVEVVAAVDVQNPLLGSRGATRVYGPQKGIRPRDYALAEKCLGRLAEVVEQFTGRDLARYPGVGAAGGLGFGMLAFAGAKLAPGFELFAREARLVEQLRWADLVLTGEGSIDSSTMMGKGVGQLAAQCRRLRKHCLGFGGVVARSGVLRENVFTRLYALTDLTSEAEAKTRAAAWLRKAAALAACEWSGRT